MIHCKKIAVVGGESTGKSTLCEQLSDYFSAPWVPEFARAYLEQLGRPYAEEDLWHIAKGQLNLEDSMSQQAQRFLFCDTNLLVIEIWSEFAYGRVHADIQQWQQERSYDAYLITAPDLPWQADPLREHPEEHLREYFFQQYVDRVSRLGVPFFIVRGVATERFLSARQFLESNFLS